MPERTCSPAVGRSLLLRDALGETLDLYGYGPYPHDTLLIGSGVRGHDVVTLAVGVPLPVFAALLYRHGSLRRGLLLTGTLARFLYVHASMAFGAAYNASFLGFSRGTCAPAPV